MAAVAGKAEVLVGVLTVSDRCSRGEAEDTSGPALVRMVEGGGGGGDKASLPAGWKVARSICVPDEKEEIKKVLLRWCDEDKLQVPFLQNTHGQLLSVLAWMFPCSPSSWC